MSPSYQPATAGQLSCCHPNPRIPQSDEVREAVLRVREAIMGARRGWMKGQPSPVCEIVRSVIGWADPEVVEGVLSDCISRDFLKARFAVKGGCHK